MPSEPEASLRQNCDLRQGRHFLQDRTNMASFDTRPCQQDASLGKLAATVRFGLSSPGVPPFLARQERPITPSFANAPG
jgi:hypothetical protein